mgnify:CR=1 FL=1|jgi:hypothetical protein
MEDVLTLYAQPYDPMRPVVCMDEKGKALPFSQNIITSISLIA